MNTNILSLFDGISCGQIALERADVKYDMYFSSEIDKTAIDITQHNYPNTIQLGDVTKLDNEKLKKIQKIDLLLGGSPCQGFSTIGKSLNFEDERSKLFFEYARILKTIKPKYFLLENVKMKKEYQDIISEYLGVEPVEINSSLVSAQNRKRLYWTNIPNITQPEDKNIGLHDVINHGVENYKIPQNWQIRVPNYYQLYVDPYNKSELFNKSNTLRTNVNNGNMWVKVPEGYRNLTREECEKLQTIPVGYTNCVSENKAKKCIGNAWTIDVITHILRNLRS